MQSANKTVAPAQPLYAIRWERKTTNGKINGYRQRALNDWPAGIETYESEKEARVVVTRLNELQSVYRYDVVPFP